MWITWCFLQNREWKRCWPNYARTCTRKERTTPWKPFRRRLPRTALGFAWRSSETRKNIRRADCCRASARRRMTELKILAVRLGSLGDIVHAFPAVSGLRTSFPNAEIIWLTHPTWKFLVSTSELATEVWTVDSRNWSNVRSVLARIKEHRFETAIDYQGLWKSAALPFLARVPRRIGFSSETVREAGVSILYTDRVKVSASEHIADQNAELSARAGANVSVGQVKLTVPFEDEQVVRARIAQDGTEDYVVLSPGGGWQSKCWPAERYGLLAKRILDQFGLRSVINVGPGEEQLAGLVAQAAGN